MRECLQKNKNLCKYLELDKERLKLQQKSFDRPKDIGLKLKIFYLNMRIKTLLWLEAFGPLVEDFPLFFFFFSYEEYIFHESALNK